MKIKTFHTKPAFPNSHVNKFRTHLLSNLLIYQIILQYRQYLLKNSNKTILPAKLTHKLFYSRYYGYKKSQNFKLLKLLVYKLVTPFFRIFFIVLIDFAS